MTETNSAEMVTDYEFREQIYDATQEANKTVGITVVIADWENRQVVIHNEFESSDSAYAFVASCPYPDRLDSYIIGGDILND